MPTTRELIRRHPNVSQASGDVWDEGREGGKWAVLRPGLVCIYSGAHTCHEWTWGKLLRAVRAAQPCGCVECDVCEERGRSDAD